MTAEEVAVILKDVKLKFSSYYKYTFYFRGAGEGFSVSGSKGGDHDDIYRMSVDADEEFPALPLEDWRTLKVQRGEEVVFESEPVW